LNPYPFHCSNHPVSGSFGQKAIRSQVMNLSKGGSIVLLVTRDKGSVPSSTTMGSEIRAGRTGGVVEFTSVLLAPNKEDPKDDPRDLLGVRAARKLLAWNVSHVHSCTTIGAVVVSVPSCKNQ
jgi:hypothetical protein